MAEAIVVGAGVVRASVTFHLAEKGMDTLVVDREGPAAGSTGSLVFGKHEPGVKTPH